MKTRVIDASVIGAAVLHEEYAEKARDLLINGDNLLAPELIYAELVNIVWKRYVRKEFTQEECLDLLTDFEAFPLTIVPIQSLTRSALALAMNCGRSTYDCFYLALAIQNNCQMWTADKRLVNALSNMPAAKHLMWIGD